MKQAVEAAGGPLRVLHVIASMAAEWGGTATTVAGLTKALAELGICSEIVTTTSRSEGPLLATPHLTRRCFDRGLAARAWSGYSRPLAAHLERTVGDFDIVHIHGLWHFGGLMAARIAKRRGVPYVVSLHGELDRRRLRHKPLKKRIYRALLLDKVLHSANALHAVSAAECGHVARLGIRTSVFVCPNGVDLAALDECVPQDEFLAQHDALQGRQIVLYMGRIDALKGLDVLAQAFVDVAAARDDVALLVAGRDEDDTLVGVQDTLRQAGIAQRVVLAGFLTGGRKSAALAGASVFVLSSYSEGFSNAVVEALAAGLPVVISEQCNFPEVERAGAGFVVPAEPGAVAEAIAAILADADLAQRMGERGRCLIEENYQWSAIANRMAQRYSDLRDAPRGLASQPAAKR